MRATRWSSTAGASFVAGFSDPAGSTAGAVASIGLGGSEAPVGPAITIAASPALGVGLAPDFADASLGEALVSSEPSDGSCMTAIQLVNQVLQYR
jgi:hypothetical protein